MSIALTLVPDATLRHPDLISVTVRGACPHDCPDTCSLLPTVENGVATRVQGNPDHTQTGGVLCNKVSRYTERTHHPERLLQPLKRVGPKGSGQYETVTFAGFKSVLAASVAAVGLAGCADLGYYWQSVNGHLTLLNAARPVDDWLGDAHTPAPLKNRLVLAQRIRSFAITELKLPDNPSYQRYADLQRSAVIWNVVAAPEFSLTLKTWCFPVAGCVGYRGYFSETEARAEAQQLKGQGFETSVYGVPAYSTLGWMNWAGGDPLLSTFISYPEGELARLVFHELAHQVAYAPGDTVFNESFATAVERLGVQRWLASQSSAAARQSYARFDGRRQQFRALALVTRRELDRIYERNMPLAQSPRAQAALKTIAMQKFRDQYAQLKVQWDGYAGYDPWVARANNASFGAQAAYDELVPGFEALFEREGRDWQGFYEAVQRLARRPQGERHALLNIDTLEPTRVPTFTLSLNPPPIKQ